MRLKNNLAIAQFSGQVISHTGRGTSLGYPTANIKLAQQIGHGIFVSRTNINGKWHPSVTFVGIPKTITKDALERTETHILHGTFELVGETITVELLQFIRPIQKFSTISELIRAITNDVAIANAYFEEDNLPMS